MEIRKIILSDIPSVVRVQNQSFREVTRRPSVGELLSDRFIKSTTDWIFVADVGNKVVGYIEGQVMSESKGYLLGPIPKDTEKKYSQIYWIAVHPQFWRRGIGGHLLAKFEKKTLENDLVTVRVGTSYARRFYEKYGYRCERTNYKLTKEITGKRIGQCNEITVKKTDIEDLDLVIKTFENKISQHFLKSFFQTYGEESDKALLGFREGKLAGAIVGRTNQWTGGFVEVIFLHGEDEEVKIGLIKNFEYECSKREAKLVGVSSKMNSFVQRLKEEGYEDAKLPDWHTDYSMIKNLR